ncbi:high-affinity branched-chain amino acid ABC transporter permease LivM [Pelagibius litoralis]|uniref:High-affinity branched-chain amino acid ABC transporter permease LivM n=1 Tax=Pelagibius litoralis TaxID=374515 RepID=A0A967EWJ1_9PROT|nr:high-affinity branched-chain amino acid ABC transporter permease LivM [Pelagibius litoralis]NIA67083.1 high-affinity branched-chain amino acid ABC transporter permease LivM [Pelagibius litoralis]
MTVEASRQAGGTEGTDLVALLKEAGLAALVALGLGISIIGIRTVTIPGGLGLEYRWDWVVIAVVSVFVGRFVLALRRETRSPAKRAEREVVMNRIGATVQRVSKIAGPVLVVIAIALPWMPFSNRYIVDIATLVLMYIMLGWGLNIVVGLAGLLDLGYVAFYAVGAYSYALIAVHFDLSFWLCLPLAGLFAATFGVLLGFPVLRLRGDYLAIVTLGFGEIIRVVLLNWYEFTRGPDGISGIPRPSFFGLPFSRRVQEGEQSFHTFFGLDYSSMHRIMFLYYLILVLALITNFFTMRIRKLPVGRAWEALREDEIACRSLGINPTNTKLTAFAIGAMFGGFAGSFFATRQGFISPESFTFVESAVILAIVVLGGMGSQIGVVIAAVLLIGGTELFRELEQFRMLAFGGAMVLIMVWRPRGLLAHRDPTLRLSAGGQNAGAKGGAS